MVWKTLALNEEKIQIPITYQKMSRLKDMEYMLRATFPTKNKSFPLATSSTYCNV